MGSGDFASGPVMCITVVCVQSGKVCTRRVGFVVSEGFSCPHCK